MRKLGVLLALCLCAGCVTEAHRRVNEGVRLRGARIAANESAPAEVRQDGAEVAAGAGALQRRVVPAPSTPVVGTSEELRADIARAGTVDAAFEWLKAKALDWLPSIPYIGGALATALGALAAFRKSRLAAKATEIVGVLGRAVESGKPLAESLASEAKALVKVNMADIANAIGDAKSGEI